MAEHYELEQARQQFIGFGHASSGYCIIDLVKAMGLTKDEYEKVRDDAETWLKPLDFAELEQHFLG